MKEPKKKAILVQTRGLHWIGAQTREGGGPTSSTWPAKDGEKKVRVKSWLVQNLRFSGTSWRPAALIAAGQMVKQGARCRGARPAVARALPAAPLPAAKVAAQPAAASAASRRRAGVRGDRCMFCMGAWVGFQQLLQPVLWTPASASLCCRFKGSRSMHHIHAFYSNYNTITWSKLDLRHIN